ncbi:MAG: DNA primase [Candidatus Nitricoxidivorans perseverans]|uniref:DNA primase n=1 Tax=Candidatus Nitricoxidivorans perseverans TaxID=2975601 RepID=A0AA49FJ57_9PROT|nr:MAG: DNA primase [Candidatus Nitricoxidivorans perseverans]
MIPESFVQELLARVDIVDVVERYVPLRKAGANHSACCPFHSEKTPSFTVSASKQFYHCFGCGAHGSAIGFLMQYSGLGFIEAVEDLAHGVGMQVPQVAAQHTADRAKKAPLTELMARAARFYRDRLKTSPRAIDYLKGRGLTGEIAAKFGLGYAPDDWQGLQGVFPDYGDPALAECGLVIENEQGRRYDRFRDRVMFPILDQRGNVIGFGGRILGNEKAADGAAAGPKYLNSPETPLFEKGRELYGLTQARAAIREADTVIVVEGYMDVVALAQHGVANAVATLGTATTPNHVHKLLRQASRVVFCFDGDAAGRKAAWRALEASLEQLADDKSVGFLFLPAEHDPDSFVRAEGADAFRRLVAHPTMLSEFLLREVKSRVDLSTHEGRAGLVPEARPLLQRLAAPMLRVQLVKAIAEAAAMAQAEVEAACGLKPMAGGRPPPPRQPRVLEISQMRTLLRAVIQQPTRAARIPFERLPTGRPEGDALHAIVTAMDLGELPASSSAGILDEFFRGTPHQKVIAAISATLPENGEDESALEQEFNDAVERMRHEEVAEAIDGEIEALAIKSRAGGLAPADGQRLRELLSRKEDMKKKARKNEEFRI